MAVTLSAEGAVASTTTATVTPVLPAHATGDILIVQTVSWGPNTTGVGNGAGLYTTTTGWASVGNVNIGAGGESGSLIETWWKRAASSAETDPVFITSGGDTGNDTCYAARGYTISGAVSSGNPWRQQVASPSYSAANGSIPGLNASQSGDLIVAFLASSDNQGAGNAPTGFTGNTAVTTATGTDAGFRSVYKTSTGALASTSTQVLAPVQGGYVWWSFSFIPEGTVPPLNNAGWGEVWS